MPRTNNSKRAEGDKKQETGFVGAMLDLDDERASF
jgi:hypothetical protein